MKSRSIKLSIVYCALGIGLEGKIRARIVEPLMYMFVRIFFGDLECAEFLILVNMVWGNAEFWGKT